uniref:Fungal lipase-like domain-containing protein n=1 Tax=Panagrolaimus superbus TaxID=310955 RepID=A0A914Z6X1_9BILA
MFLQSIFCGIIITFFFVSSSATPLWNPSPPAFNWTIDYDRDLAEFALDFASGAYASDPLPCLVKNNATMIKRVQLPCDYVHDQCWAYIAITEEWIIMTIRGTKTKLQLIMELVETMSAPKKTFPAGGSVQRYFYAAIESLWREAEFGKIMRELKQQCLKCRILFTGHSLGGALVSLASSLFAFQHRHLVDPSEIFLITFGQPRVGNQDYAEAHDKLVPNSWRLVHRYDIVAHLPYCYESIFSHQCSAAYNHGPFHHGTEIWYPEEMENNSSIFRICTGMKFLILEFSRIKDHLVYLGKDVSGYGNAGCKITEKKERLKSNKTKFNETLQN